MLGRPVLLKPSAPRRAMPVLFLMSAFRLPFREKQRLRGECASLQTWFTGSHGRARQVRIRG
eukprot:1336323-Lingulodinium_polyedra.AAC.1